ERLPPERIVALLNDYFTSMVAVAHRHRGVVLSFSGDALLVAFGVPLASGRHADEAVAAAGEMTAALDELNQRSRIGGLPELRMGVGIHTGVVFAGEVGADVRSAYTVIGDAVNVAARIEGLNKELGTQILISRETQELLTSR